MGVVVLGAGSAASKGPAQALAEDKIEFGTSRVPPLVRSHMARLRPTHSLSGGQVVTASIETTTALHLRLRTHRRP
ncbi:MAG: hypothetical protein ACRD1K_02025 [Acidimicrobiales bacterium]